MANILERFAKHRERLAFVDTCGSYTYGHLEGLAAHVANQVRPLLEQQASADVRQPRVAYMCPRDHTYVAAKFGAWQSCAIGVPIAENYPTAEIEYVLSDSGACVVIAHASKLEALEPAAKALGVPIITIDSTLGATISALPSTAPVAPLAEGAILLYTSGTTGRPKAVYHTHKNLEAQIVGMSTAWGWSSNDRILNVLPLHHVHGLVAILLTSFWNGAVCEMAAKFDSANTWAALTRTAGSSTDGPSRGGACAPTAAAGGSEPLTVFMAVPTVYARLVEQYDKQPSDVQERWSSILKSSDSQLRLIVSGSAALPEPLAVRWKNVSGHQLLERYGMTEFSMAISNPLNGTRKINAIGMPLPGYEARIVPEADTSNIAQLESGAAASSSDASDGAFAGPGELQIRGPGVFSLYWGKPEATAESFTADGWFKTGDCAEKDAEGYFHILGRLSADILKSGGYKISALEIERILLDHTSISELAVFGIPDPVYGEKIAAVVVPKEQSAAATKEETEKSMSTEVRSWAKDRLAPYKMPTVWRILDAMPRNAMGKVNKKELRKNLFGC